ncbi:hypothetical protein M426DRAFT_79796 [Hypoxylon sp. CI-4A]|nr:hypothetical protein M426DRAFT_79796 [Hypoxylon sp. CI-4A]
MIHRIGRNIGVCILLYYFAISTTIMMTKKEHLPTYLCHLSFCGVAIDDAIDAISVVGECDYTHLYACTARERCQIGCWRLTRLTVPIT